MAINLRDLFRRKQKEEPKQESMGLHQMLQQGENMTIVAEFANGRVYTLSGAYLTDEQEYNADDGTVTLRFDGMHGDWQ